ncbi:MAG: Uncharacterised protein [SAR116 cluster bacterium]|nr:MAG: Uncharacterised protein [SAR116 cluster bacterium]
MQHHSLIRHDAFRPVIKLPEIPVAAAQLALMQPDNAGAKVAQKGAVMADHQQGTAMLAKHLFHPFNGRHVHMVGRLVQQQNVGFRVERAGQRYPARLAAGQPVTHPVRIKTKPLQEFLGLVDRDRAAKAVGIMAHGDKAAQRHPARQIGGLRQIGDTGARRNPQAALIHIGAAGHQLHQAGFAGTIAPDKRQPVPGMQRQVGMAQQPAVTQIDAAIGNGQKRGRHVRPPARRLQAPVSQKEESCCAARHNQLPVSPRARAMIS